MSWDQDLLEALADLGVLISTTEDVASLFLEGNTSLQPDYQATTPEELRVLVERLRAERRAAVAKKLAEIAEQGGERRRYIVMPRKS